MTTLMINIHISFSLEGNRFIEKYFELFTKYMKAMALIKFDINLSFQEYSLFSRSIKSGEVTLHLDSKPTSVFCHMGDFGCGDGGWTPIMKINGSKVKNHSLRNSLKRQRKSRWVKYGCCLLRQRSSVFFDLEPKTEVFCFQ